MFERHMNYEFRFTRYWMMISSCAPTHSAISVLHSLVVGHCRAVTKYCCIRIQMMFLRVSYTLAVKGCENKIKFHIQKDIGLYSLFTF